MGSPAPTVGSRQALEAKALTFAGLLPQLVRCAACGEPITDAARWDPSAGGALHLACGQGDEVDPAGLRRLEALRRLPLAETFGHESGAHSAGPLLGKFVEYTLGTPLKSRDAMDGVCTTMHPDY